jgi:predicted RNase H-like HicB family nuclease
VRERSSLSNLTKLRTFEIEVARSEDGVWTATSAAIPGLNIEGDTVEEAIAEARIWAPELLRANGVVTDDETIELLFSREGERLTIE